ncbi:ArsR family transcriptional regulator [Hypnocyclicus thermotrophus]|uniref:ArsR family transcriptional regulator n=1 Tax=Hypnocyclicus thermotrophus TaxID=1627895 RepID=A0AA46I603_9FUSO|nr:metalloregulator ArsR/SmtB family transcription factor [Hypnocyclicus thermotrophus]TDT71833.1 ArsR family transcriptional regulator [Hypnocyclicus thermotrophus]
MNYDKVTIILKLLSNPIRLQILKTLCDRSENSLKTCVGELEKIIGVSQSSVSQHLAYMRNARILKYEKTGKIVCYEIQELKVKELIDFLDKL